MPLRYEIDDGARVVRFTADEIPSRTEWQASFETSMRERAGFDVLYDRRGVSEIPSSPRLRRWMLVYGRMLRDLGARRVAVLVDEVVVVYGLMRVASVFAEEEGLELAVFWSEDEARAWFGRPSR